MILNTKLNLTFISHTNKISQNKIFHKIWISSKKQIIFINLVFCKPSTGEISKKQCPLNLQNLRFCRKIVMFKSINTLEIPEHQFLINVNHFGLN